MKRTIVAIILMFINGFAYAASFNIGDKDVLIPAPQGFSYVTQDMDAVYRLSLQAADSMNDKLAYYISDSDIPTAMNGEIPPLERTFILKVSKQLKNMIIGSKDFAEIKNMTKLQNKEIFDSIKSQMPGLAKDISEGISNEFDVDFTMQLSQMVPLDPHYETDNALAYSTYVKYGVMAEGAEEEFILSSTSTIVNVAGKVLFLYCYAPKNDLEWTRSASKLWSEQIMASNSQPPTKTSVGRGIDWNKVIEKVIVGTVLGGLFSLIIGVLSIFKKKKKG